MNFIYLSYVNLSKNVVIVKSRNRFILLLIPRFDMYFYSLSLHFKTL